MVKEIIIIIIIIVIDGNTSKAYLKNTKPDFENAFMYFCHCAEGLHFSAVH